MSADLSEPAITSAVSSISDPVSPISWLGLGYHPTIDKTLILLNTGFDPWVPHWQELIEARKSEPLFGYGVVAKGRPMREGGEKGVVLVYLPEAVTGVRRARAVVHSRALANKFPEYSAIITISDPSQITEEFVRDQVNYYNQPVPTPTSSPVKPRTPAQLGINLGIGRPSASTPPPGEHPTSSPTVRAIQPSASSIRSVDRPLPPPPAAPLDLPDNPRLSTPTPPRITTPPPRSQASESMSQQHQHGRKDSLSSRFAKVLPSFTKSSKGDNGNNSGGNSPKSPKRFEAFTSGFGTGRKASGTEAGRTVEGEERRGSLGRDAGEAAQAASAIQTSDVQMERNPVSAEPNPISATPNHAERPMEIVLNEPEPHTAPSTGPVLLSHPANINTVTETPQTQSSTSIDSYASPPPLPPKNGNATPPVLNRLHTLGAIVPQSTENSSRSSSLQSGANDIPAGVSPFPMSPTASAALSTARAKQIDAETRVHDEFRRTEEERSRIRVNSGNRAAGIVRTPTPMMQQADYDDEEEGLPYDRPEVEEVKELPNAVGVGSVDGNSAAGPSQDRAEALAQSDTDALAEQESLKRETEEQIQAEAEAARAQEEEEHSKAEAARETERLAEIARVKEMEDQMRQKEEEDARLREEEERARQAEIAREEEMLAVKRAEEEEAALRAKIQAEAEARAEAMEAERERVKKHEAMRQALVKGKETGGVMLQGHVTVQTTKSVTWRRRHFQLMPTELRLYKTETDATPIQIVSLAPGTKVSQTYEESQVQGSFKISSAGDDGAGEEFFLFSDSAEEKDVLLEGLDIAVGR